MQTYTIGPWHVEEHRYPTGPAFDVYPPAYLPNGSRVPVAQQMQEANARLIAAAPDMLKVLQAIQYRATKNDQPSTEWLDAICTEVINIAKGE